MESKIALEFIRKNAARLGFRSSLAFINNARKYQFGLPGEFRDSDDPLGAFHECLKRTLARGVLVGVEKNFNGGQATRLVIHYRINPNSGDAPTNLEAIIFVHPNGQFVVASFGPIKAIKPTNQKYNGVQL